MDITGSTPTPRTLILFRFLSLPNKNQVGSCYGVNYVPLKMHVEVLTPQVAVFGDRVFTEVMNVK